MADGLPSLTKPLGDGGAEVPAGFQTVTASNQGHKRSVVNGVASEAPETTKRESTGTCGRAQALYTFQKFLNSKRFGSDPLLKIWFEHFDTHQSGRIDYNEFNRGMKSLQYPYGILGLWQMIDQDESGELFFDEIDADQARLWSSFRRWCGSTFHSPKDMIHQLKHAFFTKYGQVRGTKEVAPQAEVIEGLPLCGWDRGQEHMLFAVLDLERRFSIAAKDLKWLEGEVTRYHQKEAQKKRLKKISDARVHGRRACRMALINFKVFLRSRYGNLFRAWRRVLDVDGTMTLQKSELFKACRQVSWRGNVRTLWRALDPDDSGYCSFEELDPQGAQLLAQFLEWAVDRWGYQPSEVMWQDLDVHNRQVLDYKTFANACDSHGFHKKPQLIAAYLDSRDGRSVREDDLRCLDHWRPPAWLLATSNAKAAQDFKGALLRKYGRYIKAWRMQLDKNSSNSCNWTEFKDAAKHVKYIGDVAGAWRHFDADFSGVITLQEIDAAAHNILTDFKHWADEEFGGVKSVFAFMDKDKSKEVSFREFRSVCRRFGFEGDIQRLYENLSMNTKQQTLHLDEVAFLDQWECDDSLHGKSEEMLLAEANDKAEAEECRLQYDTRADMPGPGTYSVKSGFGAGPVLPIAKHGGSFTFGRRIWWESAMPTKVGPGRYESTWAATPRRKPAWSFGRDPDPVRSISVMSMEDRRMSVR